MTTWWWQSKLRLFTRTRVKVVVEIVWQGHYLGRQVRYDLPFLPAPTDRGTPPSPPSLRMYASLPRSLTLCLSKKEGSQSATLNWATWWSKKRKTVRESDLAIYVMFFRSTSTWWAVEASRAALRQGRDLERTPRTTHDTTAGREKEGGGGDAHLHSHYRRRRHALLIVSPRDRRIHTDMNTLAYTFHCLSNF